MKHGRWQKGWKGGGHCLFSRLWNLNKFSLTLTNLRIFFFSKWPKKFSFWLQRDLSSPPPPPWWREQVFFFFFPEGTASFKKRRLYFLFWKKAVEICLFENNYIATLPFMFLYLQIDLTKVCVYVGRGRDCQEMRNVILVQFWKKIVTSRLYTTWSVQNFYSSLDFVLMGLWNEIFVYNKTYSNPQQNFKLRALCIH